MFVIQLLNTYWVVTLKKLKRKTPVFLKFKFFQFFYSKVLRNDRFSVCYDILSDWSLEFTSGTRLRHFISKNIFFLAIIELFEQSQLVWEISKICNVTQTAQIRFCQAPLLWDWRNCLSAYSRPDLSELPALSDYSQWMGVLRRLAVSDEWVPCWRWPSLSSSPLIESHSSRRCSKKSKTLTSDCSCLMYIRSCCSLIALFLSHWNNN